MRVTIQAAGDGSARVAHLKAGTKVLIEGPYGTMTAERRTQPRMLLIAAGVGITPMRAIVDVFVGYLRRKLEAQGEERILQTVRAVGFVLGPKR